MPTWYGGGTLLRMAWGSFELRAAGWASYQDTDISEPIHVRFAEGVGGRLELVELHMGGATAITGEVLRKLNPGRLEAAANGPDVADELRGRMADSTATARRATERFLAALEPHDGADETAAASIPASIVLNKSQGRKRPDDFYREVAAAFSWLSRESDQPARDLADSNGVPVTTVHRWVKEARRRGLLPPARRRAAG